MFLFFFPFFLWPHKIGPYAWTLYTTIAGNKTARKVQYNPPHLASCLAYISQHTLYTISKLFLRSQLQSRSLYPLHSMKVTTPIDKQLPLDRRDMMADLVKPVCSLSPRIGFDCITCCIDVNPKERKSSKSMTMIQSGADTWSNVRLYDCVLRSYAD